MHTTINKVTENCPHCNETKELEIRVKIARGLIQRREVSYMIEYTYCIDCEVAWYSGPRNQLNRSLNNAKRAKDSLKH